MSGVGDSPVPLILVVCTGNLCRSPLAAALLERELDERGLPATVESAGTAAPLGASPDRKVLRAAGDLDLDLSAHRAGSITTDEIGRSSLILCMTGEHVAEVVALDPDAAKRTATLRAAALRASSRRGERPSFDEWAQMLAWTPATAGSDRSNDIYDPIGGPMRGYRQMADEVARLVSVLADAWPGDRR
ncbi:MAG: hypothetical protein M3501_11515 [Actinomycetota bacterium]|nr:hypothetical protein [Nocardioidaceae bacterium]MDQ3352575.1 hypothetical protein [Actinomycetota bacterium]